MSDFEVRDDADLDTVSQGVGSTEAPAELKELTWSDEQVLSMWHAQSRFLLGEVLTTIDAVIPSGQQNKAMKDIVRAQFNAREKWVASLCNVGLVVCEGEKMAT